MMDFDFATATQNWSAIPVDDFGYYRSADLLQWPDDMFGSLVAQAGGFRYRTDPPLGWRNLNNSWRIFFGLDTTYNKTILDFGCGLGLEALQFARRGNQVGLADIVPENVLCAERALRLMKAPAAWTIPARGTPPFFETPEPIDIFYASGVLHHTPYIREILSSAMAQLTWGGEARILLYSENLWLHQIGPSLPAIEEDVRDHPAFERFVRNDAVGTYTDWYSPAKLAYRLQGVCRITDCQYIGDGRLLGAILRPLVS